MDGFRIQKIQSKAGITSAQPHTLYLLPSRWDDFSFKTTFNGILVDGVGNRIDLGELKIGYIGQPDGWTSTRVPDVSDGLSLEFFSLGQSVEYYRQLSLLSPQVRERYLNALRDVVHDRSLLSKVRTEEVFVRSLLRGVSISSISDQYARVLRGGAVLTNYHFRYVVPSREKQAGFALDFKVVPGVQPSRNLHVLIGRNGVGKTTLLNGMINSLVRPEEAADCGQFVDMADVVHVPIGAGYFSGLVSVSFSAFDPFIPPADKVAAQDKLGYCYIGLKDVSVAQKEGLHKSIDQLPEEFVRSLLACFGLAHKRNRWSEAIAFLESDPNFQEINLGRLLETDQQDVLRKRAANVFIKMSSGHKIVLLTITRLIERAEEKTLVVMDEPESHLHPPLLSAFVRAVSDLMNKINGVAIIATHSPVILQEVPRSCVWKLYRTRSESSQERPVIETFAENVGILTRDVFQLEVTRSGFYSVLREAAARGSSYEQVLASFSGELGFEGKAILRALFVEKEQPGERTH